MTNRDSRIPWGCRRFASGAPYLFVRLRLIFLFFELVALWAELPEAFPCLVFWFFLLFHFYPVGMEWAAGVARRRERRFCFWIFDRRLGRVAYVVEIAEQRAPGM